LNLSFRHSPVNRIETRCGFEGALPKSWSVGCLNPQLVAGGGGRGNFCPRVPDGCGLGQAALRFSVRSFGQLALDMAP